MIKLSTLVEKINEDLNVLLGQSNVEFDIKYDTGNYTKATRVYNKKTYYVNGIASIMDSSLTIINGLHVAQQTVGITIAVPIDHDKPVEETVEPFRVAISKLTQTATSTAMESDGKTFLVTAYGTQPVLGDRAQQTEVGDFLPYSFSMFYSFIQNGISSLDATLTFEGKPVPFTELTPSITPNMDAGVMSSTNGSAVNVPTGDALQIAFSVPALTDSELTEEFAKFMLKKERKVYKVTLAIKGISGEYDMVFGQCNYTARGVEGVGLSVTLVEAMTLVRSEE